MRLKILGSAAGGGFPQWNCACANCSAVRSGRFAGKARLQTQLAVSSNDNSWFLLGASPDLRQQIESNPELHPSGGIRSSPVAGVVLASADLDHVLGVLLLRELQPFGIWATSQVTDVLRTENSVFRMLNRVENQVRWNTIRAGESFALTDVYGRESGISCRAYALSSRLPAYARSTTQSEDAVIGLVLESANGKTVGFFPQLPALTPELQTIFSSLDCLLLDGTFWSNDELIELQGSGQTAREMGHIPVSGEDGTLRALSGLTKPRKIYIHINNTNPMLNEQSEQYRTVRNMGWELAEDGCQLTL
ncbi:MAG TPA: pyrroloquinoline quinone biosynthesis protein PqqB [Dongiaceae bacterium]|nr:pyrroloquinoline quinone biosynthesis protein PqqB [Dongiaceae bacterium]